MRIWGLSCLFFISIFSYGQEYNPTIHQEQSEFYGAQNKSTDWYENNVNTEVYSTSETRAEDCNLEKVVYGWHPYWVGSAHLNYQWNLLSHLSFFSYEVDENTGLPLTTHGWMTADAVDSALANGVKTTLCVTLFGSSNLTTFLTNPTAKATLISELIDRVSARGAHGVNIDFEGLPASQKTNFANFMVDLSDAMHAAIPGSEVSTVLYAVDWSNVFDFGIMADAVDHFIVMGYAYYYQGSSNTGPCDPLYHFGSTYNYTLSKTITYYLDKGCPKDKLIMGLPYYGYEWPTASLSIPSSTTGSGVAKTYAQVKTNSSGNYIPANHTWDADSYTDIYTYVDGGNKQTYITLEDGFQKRLAHINQTGIGGIGIWALGYDNGYDYLWESIEMYFTDCYEDPCVGNFHDFGGPTKNYYNDESYTWTIAPTDADQMEVNFSDFNVEVGYDTLFIYDGASISDPLIGTYTGTSSPGTFLTSSGSITFYWKSDGATIGEGFNASYECFIYDPIANFMAPDNPEICEDETIEFTNTSTGASSYFWEFPGGTPATSTAINPIIAYSSSGTYNVILNAIDGVDTSTTVSSIDVDVFNYPVADWSSSSPAYIPSTVIYFTNESINGTSFYWTFGDGTTSSDASPWHNYGGTGNFDVQLITTNEGCGSDSISAVVEVIDNLSVMNPQNQVFTTFPNPVKNELYIEFIGQEIPTRIELFAANGELIHTEDLIPSQNGIVTLSNLEKFDAGEYYLRVIYNEAIYVQQIIKL